MSERMRLKRTVLGVCLIVLATLGLRAALAATWGVHPALDRTLFMGMMVAWMGLVYWRHAKR